LLLKGQAELDLFRWKIPRFYIIYIKGEETTKNDISIRKENRKYSEISNS
jgi:hypothetical protein